jgi:hypothetical protein
MCKEIGKLQYQFKSFKFVNSSKLANHGYNKTKRSINSPEREIERERERERESERGRQRERERKREGLLKNSVKKNKQFIIL